MKKLFTSLAAALVLAGCFGSGPVDPVVESPTDDPNAVTITDDFFIELSAKILCLPANNPESSAAEIEVLAKDLLAVGGVAEADFTAYQEGIEANPTRKSEISNAIVGQMADFCSITSSEPEVEVPETIPPTTSSEDTDDTGEPADAADLPDSGTTETPDTTDTSGEPTDVVDTPPAPPVDDTAPASPAE